MKQFLYDKTFDVLKTHLPEFDKLDKYVDYLMPYIGRFSEDLYEKTFYVNKRWREVRDDVTFQEQILFVFKEDGKCLRIVDGDIQEGAWELPSTGGFVLKIQGRYELYEKKFINEDFFIICKHGDTTKRDKKYFFLAQERVARGREWRELVEIMYDLYRYNISYIFMIAIAIGIVALVLWFSLL